MKSKTTFRGTIVLLGGMLASEVAFPCSSTPLLNAGQASAPGNMSIGGRLIAALEPGANNRISVGQVSTTGALQSYTNVLAVNGTVSLLAELQPKISPQGWLAYVANENNLSQLYVCKVTTGQGQVSAQACSSSRQMVFAQGSGLTSMMWSPDGGTLFFVSRLASPDDAPSVRYPAIQYLRLWRPGTLASIPVRTIERINTLESNPRPGRITNVDFMGGVSLWFNNGSQFISIGNNYPSHYVYQYVGVDLSLPNSNPPAYLRAKTLFEVRELNLDDVAALSQFMLIPGRSSELGSILLFSSTAGSPNRWQASYSVSENEGPLQNLPIAAGPAETQWKSTHFITQGSLEDRVVQVSRIATSGTTLESTRLDVYGPDTSSSTPGLALYTSSLLPGTRFVAGSGGRFITYNLVTGNWSWHDCEVNTQAAMAATVPMAAPAAPKDPKADPENP